MYIKYNCVPLKKPVNTWLRDVVYVMRTECLRIGSFNIQVFGQKKVENEKVLSYIVQILERYDLVVILEIRDKKGTAFQKLFQELNQQSNESYASYVSEALGRSTSKEQYGVLYKISKLSLSRFQVFPDPYDKYERPPMGFIVHIKEKGFPDFGWIAVHLDPDSVEAELNALYETAENFRKENKLDDILLAGDMNAGCRYLSKRRMRELSLIKDTHYYWLINDERDTTVHSNNCALDRMIVYGTNLKSAIKGQRGCAYRYDNELNLDSETAKAISDHYPIEVEMQKTTKDISSVTRTNSFENSTTLLIVTTIANSLRLCIAWVAAECLRIGSFNIQVFGQKKVENEKVLSYIVQILERYDLVVILEIRDKKGTAFQKLFQELNQQSNESYASYVSEALGRTVSKEQYGVLYKRTKVTVTSFSVFPDPQDKFERPPLGFIVNVDGGSLRFGWVAVHLDPDSVETELNALYESAEAFRGQNKLENVLLAGDMNADCRYLSDRKMKQLSLMKDTSYYWLIDDGYDTTVHSNDCALDRMIVYGNELKSAIKGQKAEAYRYDDEMKLDHKMAKEISDHYPVEFEIEKMNKPKKSASRRKRKQ
ncbi:Deoxyribonuclease-1 [Clonorchis sinensis]|uniref:Deoxyribonuclease-1 n=1 Tax=Clonorchis sinensis TaxID=79923 RepID=A0A8T1MQP1_CLOSI|nr:Deoxyribonuclease-1 [Clonorchis sinensis]